MAVDRFRYLALALDTRMVIDSLIEFIDQGTRKRGFDESLQEVLDSVLAFDKGGLYSQLHSHRLAEYYEQVETLDEVSDQLIARVSLRRSCLLKLTTSASRNRNRMRSKFWSFWGSSRVAPSTTTGHRALDRQFRETRKRDTPE